MSISDLKLKPSRREPSFGSWMFFDQSSNANIFPLKGLDFLAIHMEHAPIDPMSVECGVDSK